MWGVAVGAVIGIVLATASPWLPRMFSSQTDVVATATPALVVAASAMPLAGAVYLFDGVLMGAGDGRYLAGAGLVTLVPYLPLAVAVAQGWPSEGAEGLVWLWGAFAWVFMGARALTTGLRAAVTPGGDEHAIGMGSRWPAMTLVGLRGDAGELQSIVLGR